MHHELRAGPDTVHGWFDRALPPALTLDPGDTVRFTTWDCWWSAGPLPVDESPATRPRMPGFAPDAGHALTGPVRVRGVAAGSTLAVRVDEVVPEPWGTTVTGGSSRRLFERYGVADRQTVHRWQLDPTTATGRNQHGHTVTLRPFMGVMGVAPAEPGRHSTIPPRRVGGNLDCRDLVAGSTLYLPVAVDGALFSTGDGHAAQGDGEVGGTAIECPMTVTLTFETSDLSIDTPVARTAEGWVSFGVAATLDEASGIALEALFRLMHRQHGLGRGDAVALASVAADLRVTQIVNRTVGVHAVLPHGAIR